MATIISQEVLERHRKFLEERIDADSGLLDKLLANETLTGREIRDIRKHQTFDERNSKLLDYILEKKKVICLVASLNDTRQTHLVNYLAGDRDHRAEFGDDWPLGKDQISILDVNQEKLVEILDPTDLIGQMFSAEILNYRQQKSISSEPNVFVKIQSLLDDIRRRSLRDYKKTIECLHATNQSHIAQILEEGGVVVRVRAEMKSEEIDETEEEIIARFAGVLRGKSWEASTRILEGTLNVIAAKRGQSVVLYVYCKTLKDLMRLQEMNSSGKLCTVIKTLFTQLLSHVILTSINVENLRTVVESVFNQILCRSQIQQLTASVSEDEFNRCRAYFPESTFVRTVRDFSRADMNAAEMKDLRKSMLREEWNESGDTRSVDYGIYSDESFDLTQMVLYFGRGEYFEITDYVNIGDDFTYWKAKRLSDGQIGFIPRNRVVIDYDWIQLKQQKEISLSPDQLKTVDQLARKQKTRFTHKTANDLPLELLDIILHKSYAESILCENQLTDRDVIWKMASVDNCWFNRIQRRKFKNSIWRHLAAVYADASRRAAIYRDNRPYLLQNIAMSRSLMRRLRSSDCLTDWEARLISCRLQKKKDAEKSKTTFAQMETVLERISHSRRSTFSLCLRQISQPLPAKVLENGGAAVKATILSYDIRHNKSFQQDLVERLNGLRDRHHCRSHQIDKLISQLKNENIELLKAVRDKNPSLWLWCRSQTALNAMDSAEFLRRLSNVLALLSDVRWFGAESAQDVARRSLLINIDADQRNRTAAFFSSAISLTSTLDVSEEYVIAGAKLDDRIFVLCGSAGHPSAAFAVLVFEDRSPFVLQRRISVEEIRRPWDMGSSRLDNCLYVTDLESQSIWKMAGDDYRPMRWLSGIGAPFTISVSSEGELCLTRIRQSRSSLEIYGPDAQLVFHVLLPKELRDPLHAIETSTGSFIVLYRKRCAQRTKESEELAEDGAPPDRTESSIDAGNLMWGISEVTRDGCVIINCFLPANGSQFLNHPEHLAAVDSELFVADTRNDRVIQLNPNLTWNQTLIPAHQMEMDQPMRRRISWPKRLHYDERNRQLLVVGGLNGGVHVYTFQ